MSTYQGLLLGDSADRALTCAGTAADADVCINLELAVAHADSANRALSLTSTASYTSITDNICHNNFLLLCDKFISIAFLHCNTNGGVIQVEIIAPAFPPGVCGFRSGSLLFSPVISLYPWEEPPLSDTPCRASRTWTRPWCDREVHPVLSGWKIVQ